METAKQNYNSLFRQLIFLAILILGGIVLFGRLKFFVSSFLGAVTFYVVVRGLLFKLTEKLKWKRWAASLFIVACITILLLAIGVLIFDVIANEIIVLDMSKIMDVYNSLLNKINEFFGISIETKSILVQSTSYITKAATGVVNAASGFLLNLSMMILILYFMLANAKSLEQVILRYQPFRGQSLDLIKKEVKNMIFSNAVGIPLVMLGQSLTAYIIYALCGMDNAIFWAFLTALCGLIPMIGTGLVYLPLGIYMITRGEVLQGILLIGLCLLIVTTIDNFIRIILNKKAGDVHPLIVIFGIIAGIPLFGFWGIIFGPLMLSGFLLLVRIYYHEYNLLHKAELSKAHPKQ